MTRSFRKTLIAISFACAIASNVYAKSEVVKYGSGTSVLVSALSGSTINGDCVQFDASGDIKDSGSACGGGSGISGITADSGGTTTGSTVTIAGDTTATSTARSSNTITVSLKSNAALGGNPTTTTQASTDNSTRVATTAYVTTGITNALNGLDWKPAVGYATTANVVGTNTAGVFTYTATGTDSIDGHTLALNDVVLFKNQTAGADNGVWVVTTAGAIGVAGVLTRRADYNTAADIQQGDAFYVLHGTTNTNTAWVQTAVVNTIDSDALAFSQVAGPGSYTGSNGVSVSGTTISGIDAIADGSTLGVAAFTAADFNSSSGVISLDYTNGQKASSSQPGFSTANQTVGTIGVTLDGGGSVLITGQKGYITVPYGCTIVGWDITADGASPTCTIDVWKVATGTALPTVANTIMGTKPALSSGNAIHSTTLTGWTTSVSAADIIGFNLDAVTVATKITFVIEVAKS